MGCCQRGACQREQAMLTEAQVLIERLTEVAERLPNMGLQHTPCSTRFSSSRKTLHTRASWLSKLELGGDPGFLPRLPESQPSCADLAVLPCGGFLDVPRRNGGPTAGSCLLTNSSDAWTSSAASSASSMNK